MLKKLTVLLLLFTLKNANAQTDDLAKYVNPFIGTAAHGHTFPGATTPFGMVQLSPDTDDEGWDWCSGYNYQDSTIMGFSHTHLSGTGIADLADVLVMPYLGSIVLQAGKKDGNTEGYRSKFSHKDEKAEAGYYSVLLKKYGIKAELTASANTGFHRYTFPKSDSANVIIDLLHGLDRHRTWLTEKVLDAEIRILDSNTIVGYRISNGWAKVQPVYFTMHFSKPFKRFGTASNDVFQANSPYKRSGNVKAVVSWATTEGEQIEVETFISAEKIYPDAIFPVTDVIQTFESTKTKTRQLWNTEFNKVKIEASTDTKTTFYTAFYHAFIAPNTIEKEYTPDFSALSLWDTYRAQFPLMAIFQNKKVGEIFKSLPFYTGPFPVWRLWGNETDCMIGTPAVPAFVDFALKKYEGGSEEYANNGSVTMHRSLTQDATVSPWHLFDKYGYIPNDLGENFTVSKTLEMCYANGCAALLAKKMGDVKGFEFYEKRSKYYKNLFDPSVGFFRGKDSKGNWTTPFDPSVTNENDFVEATPWQYLFHVQHDIEGLTELFGGKAKMAAKLDSLFIQKNIKIDAHILDISGLIGQYAHGNEPSHHVAYLYNAVGQPWKTQERVREICEKFYTSQPDGLCGNEDCGQMSAWYIFSAMGFYPVHPSSGRYELGVPMVESAVLNLENGKQFQVKTKNFKPKNKYVKSVKLNGQILKETSISHVEILRGGILEFEMTDRHE